ncbi:hypothetical protein MLD38_013332 [Melastoma candidum]|uniref:Uncharacterized protein n=1 Tax=Melastoma candidum TaxID=119954 RepID=A0ACB9R981_9MYRT|nr:hypothetical protein MLD38_013332 [Melastoma candidum]
MNFLATSIEEDVVDTSAIVKALLVRTGGFVPLDESTYKVKKIVAALNESQVPPPDVLDVVVCPSADYMDLVRGSLRGDFQIAAEIHAPSPAECLGIRNDDVFTWQYLSKSLSEESIPWVILGTSKRRVSLNESNTFVGEKVVYVLDQCGMKVIACVGETCRQREAGETMDVISAQTKAIAAERVTNWENVVLAYDPAWATGTGKVVTPPQVQEVHSEIRKCLEASVNAEVASMTRIICAVPLTSKNCPELAAQSDVDGFLVRGAPLKPEFIGILMSATTQDEA